MKYWWTQAEALLSALHMYILTGRPMYYEVFERVLDWIDGHQTDWEGGEWHYAVHMNGKTSGEKASVVNDSWKTPYHGGRALIHSIELLDAASASPSNQEPAIGNQGAASRPKPSSYT